MRAAKLRGFIRLQPPALGKLRVFSVFQGDFHGVKCDLLLIHLSLRPFYINVTYLERYRYKERRTLQRKKNTHFDPQANIFSYTRAGKPVSSPTIRKIIFTIRKIVFIIRKIIFPLILDSFCYKLCNMYYKLANMRYKVCNMYQKLCNKLSLRRK